MNNLLTLSDVLGRSVSVDWHEGVALVRGVVERLLERPSEPPVVPELHQIQLSPIGRIDVFGGTTSNDSVRRLGQLLQAILGHSEPPVQLRLFVAQATAPTPAFGSIREYDAALAFFERPGRDTVLQTLYARAAAALPVSDSKSTQTLDAIAPLPTPERPKDISKRNTGRSKPGASRLVAGGVVLLVVCTACVLYGRGARHVSGARDVSTIALQTSDAVGSAIVSGLSAVTERVGLGRLVSADAPSVAPPSAVGAPPPRTSRVNRAATQLTPQVPLVAFDLESSTATPAPTGIARFDLERTVVASEPSADKAETGEELVIYSPASEGVSPPVGVRPHLPRELPSNVNRDHLCLIELVVSTAGTVDSVRLLSAPRNVHDSMFLSAAKAWQFQPALKDGLPVKYRKTVWISTQ